jgi:hypothetical protein
MVATCQKHEANHSRKSRECIGELIFLERVAKGPCLRIPLNVILYTRQKTPSPLLNRIGQCFAAHVVHTCQQYC